MATIDELVGMIEKSRAHFLKHVAGMTDEQCRWKPYPECKNVLETLAHLRVDDLAALDALESGEEPRYEEISMPIMEALPKVTREELEEHLRLSHQDLKGYLKTKYGTAPADTAICVWGTKMPLALGVPYYSSEDFYHAGQVAFIRQAQDPSWNYYAAVYGGE